MHQGPKAQESIGLLSLERDKTNTYNFYMKKYLYSFFLIGLALASAASLCMAQAGIPAAVTGTKALLEGTASLQLAPTGIALGTVSSSFFADETIRYSNLLKLNTQQLTIAQQEFQTSVSESLQNIQRSSTKVASPRTLGAWLPDLSIFNRYNQRLMQRRFYIAQLQQLRESVLYDWGFLQDQAGVLGYTSTPILQEESNGQILLQLNNRSVLIQINSSVEEEGVSFLSPRELQANAHATDLAQNIISLNELEAALQEDPQQFAAYFYLRKNFRDALTNFATTEQAYNAYMKEVTNASTYQRARNWLIGESEKGKQIKQNYLNASANLALHMSKLLSFMALHPTPEFARSLRTYKELMKIKNETQPISSTFQTFWLSQIPS